MSKLQEYILTARFQILIWSQLIIELNRKEDKTDGIFIQFQEQGKDVLTSLMIAAKILMNSECKKSCKKSEMRHSLQNQTTEI